MNGELTLLGRVVLESIRDNRDHLKSVSQGWTGVCLSQTELGRGGSDMCQKTESEIDGKK